MFAHFKRRWMRLLKLTKGDFSKVFAIVLFPETNMHPIASYYSEQNSIINLLLTATMVFTSSHQEAVY